MTGEFMKPTGDIVLAGTLTSSPMWVPILSNINIVLATLATLATLTLLIGVSLALGRLWFMARNRWPLRDFMDWLKQRIESPPPGGPYF